MDLFSSKSLIKTKTALISPAGLLDLLSDGGELAIIDIREAAIVHKEGTILSALTVPLGVLELRVGNLVPRRTTRIVVIDSRGEGAIQAADRLSGLGYSNVSYLAGGSAAWREAGHPLYPSGHALGQAFGEVVEQALHTPAISAKDLAELIDAKQKLLVLDIRSPEEFHHHSLPGGISCPGPEIARRIDAAGADSDTLIVVNCAGRTRSILGAQTLIDLGLPHRVVALENGLMGWRLAGRNLAHHASKSVSTPADLTAARGRAQDLAEREGISRITGEDLNRLATDEDRTLFLLDVRTPEEFAAGHRPSAKNAPSWELVPWAFKFIGVRHARIVLTDDDGIRATVCANWLRRMGWRDIRMLIEDPSHLAETGVVRPILLDEPQGVEALTPEQARTRQEKGAVIIDLGPSSDFRVAHPEGARWALRSRLQEALAKIPTGLEVIFLANDDILARYAARDAANEGRSAFIVAGGLRDWEAAGLPVEAGAEQLFLVAPDDQFTSPWGNGESDFERFRAYLDWEIGLAEQIARDPAAPYDLPGRVPASLEEAH